MLVPRLTESAQPVRVRIQATGEVIAAPVMAIVPDTDPLSRLVPIRLQLQNSGRHLRPGMSIAGLVPTGRHEPMLTVHKDAILRDDAGEFVYFDAGGRAAVARIQTIFPHGQRVAVRSTMLTPQMAVIVEGNERISPGAELNITATRDGDRGEGTPEVRGGETAPAGGTGEGR
jgi:multidrug efflux pump subunit AcrA (membrane-fusion protein)